tara:strand:+ start:521 stop:784 length:264 start_codon:yes stop_codon:yes gene_type:complete
MSGATGRELRGTWKRFLEFSPPDLDIVDDSKIECRQGDWQLDDDTFYSGDEIKALGGFLTSNVRILRADDANEWHGKSFYDFWKKGL